MPQNRSKWPQNRSKWPQNPSCPPTPTPFPHSDAHANTPKIAPFPPKIPRKPLQKIVAEYPKSPKSLARPPKDPKIRGICPKILSEKQRSPPWFRRPARPRPGTGSDAAPSPSSLWYPLPVRNHRDEDGTLSRNEAIKAGCGGGDGTEGVHAGTPKRRGRRNGWGIVKNSGREAIGGLG